MPDREFIKAELQKLQKILENRSDMYISNDKWDKSKELLSFAIACSGALELLKAQEEVKPRVSSVEQRCGNCNKVIEMDGWKACPWCGKPILWEGR